MADYLALLKFNITTFTNRMVKDDGVNYKTQHGIYQSNKEVIKQTKEFLDKLEAEKKSQSTAIKEAREVIQDLLERLGANGSEIGLENIQAWLDSNKGE